MLTGKCLDGIDDKNNRKSGCTLKFPNTKSRTIDSRDGIHEIERWQFCRYIQLPTVRAFAMRASAVTPVMREWNLL